MDERIRLDDYVWTKRGVLIHRAYSLGQRGYVTRCGSIADRKVSSEELATYTFCKRCKK